MNKNKALLIAGIVFGSFLLLFVAGNVFVDIVADRVIQKLTKEYCPSPYGPGVDPDKFDVNIFQKKSQTTPQTLRKRTNYPWE